MNITTGFMAIDWALQEAMEEVDAITPACRPIAPTRPVAEMVVGEIVQTFSQFLDRNRVQVALANQSQIDRSWEYYAGLQNVRNGRIG